MPRLKGLGMPSKRKRKTAKLQEVPEPDVVFDYEGFLERELSGSAPRSRGREWRRLAWVALLLLFLWVVLTR